MTNKNNIPAVSEKDTKGAIIEKFNQVVELLKAKDAAKLDPAKEVAQKAVASTLEKAATVVKADVGTQINDMAGVVTKALTDALAEINTRVADYKDLDGAITLKRAELKELFDIEAGAYALIALINMQEDQINSFDEEMAAKKEAANADLQSIIVETKERRAALNTEMAEARKELEAARKREAIEFKYDLDRSRKLEADKWADDQDAKLKAFNAELAVESDRLGAIAAELNKRDEEITVKETTVADLQAKVDAIPGLVEAAAAKAAKEAKTSADISNGFEVRALRKDAESAAALAEAKIKTLEDALDAEKGRTAGLEAKLDAAYEKIESISGKAVEAAAGVKYIDRIENTYKEQGKLASVK
jgi:predicted  nucleic acid-binding Zn-ribbon protein